MWLYCPFCGYRVTVADKNESFSSCSNCHRKFCLADRMTPIPISGSITVHAKLLAVIIILAAVTLGAITVSWKYATADRPIAHITPQEIHINKIDTKNIEVPVRKVVAQTDTIPLSHKTIPQSADVQHPSTSKKDENVYVKISIPVRQQPVPITEGYHWKRSLPPVNDPPVDLYSLSQPELLTLAKKGDITPLEYRDIMQQKCKEYWKEAKKTWKRRKTVIFVGFLSGGSRRHIKRGILVPPKPSRR